MYVPYISRAIVVSVSTSLMCVAKCESVDVGVVERVELQVAPHRLLDCVALAIVLDAVFRSGAAFEEAQVCGEVSALPSSVGTPSVPNRAENCGTDAWCSGCCKCVEHTIDAVGLPVGC